VHLLPELISKTYFSIVHFFITLTRWRRGTNWDCYIKAGRRFTTLILRRDTRYVNFIISKVADNWSRILATSARYNAI